MSRAQQHPPLPDDVAARWSKFGRGDDELYVNLLGLVVEEIRTDYCRMRMPFRPVLNQAAGIVHGGAIAGLLDSVVVPFVEAEAVGVDSGAIIARSMLTYAVSPPR
jgi:acyl-coenzyme A thioesterase PaaI-like protein